MIALALAVWAMPATPLATADDVLAYLEKNPSNVSLAVFDEGAKSPALTYGSPDAFPLASTAKAVVLVAYARAAASGVPAFPLAELNALYWPGTDGDAHERALADWKRLGAVRDGKVDGAQVARAMIDQSDNAAADELMLHVGREKLAAVAGEFRVETPCPIVGQFLQWGDAAWREKAARLGRTNLATEAWELAARRRAGARLGGVKLFWPQLPALADQEADADLANTRGTAAAYARLMNAVFTTTEPWGAIARDALSWPMRRFDSNRARFDVFGAKGGSLPGVLTDAIFIRRKGAARGRAAALFFRRLPPDDWRALMQSYAQQAFLVKLATDDAYAARVKKALAP